jgi:deazaflavin-dependent oxidoreductase (nitroreductase family)
MSPQRYSPLNRMIHRMASNALVARTAALVLPHIDRLWYRASGGRATLTGLLAGLPVVTMTTTGAKSGLPRTVPLLFIRDPQQPARFALIASNWGQDRFPAWYFNLRAKPQATCVIDGRSAAYIARELGGSEYDQFWQYAQQTYLGFPSYRRRIGEKRHIPIILMEPV